MHELETERLLLRQWRNEDFEAYAEVYADEELAQFIGGACDRPTAWRRFAAMVGHWSLRGFGFFVVEEKESGAFAGSVGLWFPEGWPEMEVGYWLTSDMQGKGYASEAALRCREHAYATMGATTLVSYIHPDNVASKKVAERIGAAYEQTIELATFGPHCVYRHPGGERD